MNFLDESILDNSIRSLLWVFGTIAIVSICRRWLSRSIASLLYIPIQHKWKSVEKNKFTGLIIKPLGWFLAVLIAVLVLDNLVFPSAWRFSIYNFTFDAIIHKIAICSVIIFLIWVVLSFIDFIALVLEINAKLTIDKRDDQIIVFFRDFFKVIVYIIGILLILKAGFNVNIGSILTGLSIIGAALALAAKESIENLIASFIIFFDKPFFTGDTVKVNAVAGTIEHIGLRSTRIRTIEQTLITVPNKQMVDGVVDNWNLRTARRAEIKIELDNTNSTMQIEHFITNIKSFLEKKEPEVNNYTVFITDFNKTNLTITVEYFTKPFSMETFLTLKQEFNIYIKTFIETEKLRMATAGHDITIVNSESGNGNPNINSKII